MWSSGYGRPGTHDNTRKEVRHVRSLNRVRPPPPSGGRGPTRWDQLPPATRQHLLRLLSQLLARQWRQGVARRGEGGDDADTPLQ